MRDILDYAGNVLLSQEREKRNNAISSILIEYGRLHDTSYCFCRIPKVLNDGSVIAPRAEITNITRSLNYTKMSTLDYSTQNNTIFCINASLFGNANQGLTPLFFTVIDGISYTNNKPSSAVISQHEEYPLCIFEDGTLDTPYWDSSVIDTQQLINDGVIHAVTGWGTLIYEYEKTGTDKFDEQVHLGERLPQQVIGQYQNGDYFVFTSDGPRGNVENEAGMIYDEVADFLVSRGVKFAYALDGGGSVETVIGKRQLNPIYENTTGRIVPVVIRFDIIGD